MPTKPKAPASRPAKGPRFHVVQTNPGWTPARWAVTAAVETRKEGKLLAAEVCRALNAQKGTK